MPASQSSVLVSSLRPFLYLAAAALLVTILWLAQTVLVPVILAAILGFVLIPPVAALERRGLHRLASVGLVLLVCLGMVAGFGYVVSRQFTDFASRMPRYSVSIKAKLATLREARNGPLARIQETVAAVSHELDKQEGPQGQPAAAYGPLAPRNDTQPVTVVPSEPTDVERLRAILVPIITPIATAGIVLILVAFILVQREDIRNRLIRLVGRARVTVTTKTMDDAGQRISRFLFSQSLINAAFGIIVALGLILIGVPYALLWGMTAAILRFVPYLGSMLALLMPAALAFVGSAGWGPTIQTVALFLAVDAITAYVIEPVWIGTRTGVSSLALLISALFWTWLWGPIGLLLSTPLTVCLAVIGKHVPALEFLAILLGDDPPLEADVTLYQRLLAGDEDEASEILERQLRDDARPDVFDAVVMPALILAERECLREEISQAEQQFVIHTMLEILRNNFESTAAPAEPSDTGDAPAPRTILGVPARNASDQIALEMLTQVLGQTVAVHELSTATLVSEVLVAVEETAPDALCIIAVPPGGLSHARYLCKRVRSQFPNLPILVLRPGSPGQTKAPPPLNPNGTEKVVASFTAAITELNQMILTRVGLPPAFLTTTAFQVNPRRLAFRPLRPAGAD